MSIAIEWAGDYAPEVKFVDREDAGVTYSYAVADGGSLAVVVESREALGVQVVFGPSAWLSVSGTRFSGKLPTDDVPGQVYGM